MKNIAGGDVIKLDVRKVNTHFLINELFDGDAHKALAVCRRYPRTKFTLAPLSIEREMILDNLRKGVAVDDIVEALSTDEHKVNRDKVVRLQKGLKAGKYEE